MNFNLFNNSSSFESSNFINDFNNRWEPVFQNLNPFKEELPFSNKKTPVPNIWNGEIFTERKLNNRNCRVTVEHPDEKKENEEKLKKQSKKQPQPIHTMGPRVTVEGWDPDEKA